MSLTCTQCKAHSLARTVEREKAKLPLVCGLLRLASAPITIFLPHIEQLRLLLAALQHRYGGSQRHLALKSNK
jgi:hypothetical protein